LDGYVGSGGRSRTPVAEGPHNRTCARTPGDRFDTGGWRLSIWIGYHLQKCGKLILALPSHSGGTRRVCIRGEQRKSTGEVAGIPGCFERLR
jgi:hypothetical protein